MNECVHGVRRVTVTVGCKQYANVQRQKPTESYALWARDDGWMVRGFGDG